MLPLSDHGVFQVRGALQLFTEKLHLLYRRLSTGSDEPLCQISKKRRLPFHPWTGGTGVLTKLP